MSPRPRFAQRFRSALLAVSLAFAASVLAPRISSAATPAQGRTGIGLIFGYPTALNGKTWQDERRAVDAGLAYSFGDSIALYGDFLLHFHGTFKAREAFVRELSPYVGIGGLMLSSKDPPRGKRPTAPNDTIVNFNLRIPLGIEWLPPSIPISVFLEIVPGIYLVPDTAGAFQGGLGFRYWF